MEVILRADVPKLGPRGKVVDVAPGYARNFLLPRKLAVPVTAGNKKVVEQEKAAGARREANERSQSEELARQLADLTVTVVRKAGEADQLFGSVTSLDVADAFQAKGYHIDRRKIDLEEPIKHLGEYEIPLRLHRDVSATLKLLVVQEE
jgi:large subunit ribosomal protein L9